MCCLVFFLAKGIPFLPLRCEGCFKLHFSWFDILAARPLVRFDVVSIISSLECCAYEFCHGTRLPHRSWTTQAWKVRCKPSLSHQVAELGLWPPASPLQTLTAEVWEGTQWGPTLARPFSVVCRAFYLPTCLPPNGLTKHVLVTHLC